MVGILPYRRRICSTMMKSPSSIHMASVAKDSLIRRQPRHSLLDSSYLFLHLLV